MGNARIGPIVLIISMIALGLIVVMTILTGPGNVIGATYRFAWIPALIVGCVAPRISIYVLAIFAAYLDVPKKFLVVANVLHLDFQDVYFILAVPPVMLLGMVMHYIASFALRVRPMTKRDSLLLFVATGLVAATSIIAIAKTGIGMQALKPLANTSAYYGLIFVLPLALPTVADVQKFFRFVILIMIPAAFHALWHYFFGLFEFEYAYMDSNFSINMKYVLTGEGIFGPFSAQGPLATCMSICAAICLTPFFLWISSLLSRRRGSIRVRIPKEYRILPTFVCFLLFFLFLAAAVLSLKRGPLLIIPAVVFGLFVLRSGLLTIATYGAGITAFVLLVIMGEDLAYQLEAWQTKIYSFVGHWGPSSDLFRVRTFHTRFVDFSLLADSRNWAPFGAEIAEGEDGYRAHALVVRFILKYGYVPMGIAAAIIVPSLFFLHRRLLKISKGKTFEIFQLRLMASLAFALLGASAIGVLSMEAYPNPFFFGVFLGVMAAGLTRVRHGQESSSTSVVLDPNQPPVLGPGGVRPVIQ